MKELTQQQLEKLSKLNKQRVHARLLAATIKRREKAKQEQSNPEETKKDTP